MMEIGVDYTGVRIGTLVVVDNKVLLVKDKMGFDPEKWTVPTAMLKRFEKIKYAVDREIYEEFNIELETEKVLNVLDLFDESRNMHMIVPIYQCKLVKGEARKMNYFKYTDMKWFDLEELPEGILKGIDEAIEIFKKGKCSCK